MKRKLIMLILIVIFSVLLFFSCFSNLKRENKKQFKIKKEEIETNSEEKRSGLYVFKSDNINQEYTIIYPKEESKSEVNVSDDFEKNDGTIQDNVTVIEEESNRVFENVEDIDNEEDKEKITDAAEEEMGIKVNDSNETPALKNGFYDENNVTYYYENDEKATGIKNIDGVNHYFSPSGRYLGTNKVKVIDVSYYQKDINWETFIEEGDCYGAILRLGYWTTLDKKFERNINELKRLNIPYGIYLFSYATSRDGAKKEADFTNKMIDKYNIEPSLGIYYDLESWKTKTASSDNISKNSYNYIAKEYVESIKKHTNNMYLVGVYSGRWFAMNRLGKVAKNYVLWVAEYNNTLKYDSTYKMWQYTSKAKVPGINGNVDVSYLYNGS